MTGTGTGPARMTTGGWGRPGPGGSTPPVTGEPLVRLVGVTRRFGDQVAVQPADLVVRQGDFLAILGPSGCGKTSLLKMIGGFLEPTGGRIEIAGQDVTHLGPERRPTNMVFQGYGLFPHMTVRQNVAYGLRIARVPEPEVAVRVAEMLSLVHLQDLADRPAPQLSGGQAQRVALARALVMRPKVLLLDEPLAALDLQLRRAMQEELRRLHRSLGGTFVFVTHDQEEAMGLANVIVVMQNGRIVQAGSPSEIYQNPDSEFVARFVGEANLLSGRRAGNVVRLEAGVSFDDPGADGRVAVVVRPQAVALHPEGHALPPGHVALTGRVLDRMFLGDHWKYVVDVAGLEIRANVDADTSRSLPETDAAVVAAWPIKAQRILTAS